MGQNELLSLRERILKDITPLVLETADKGEVRFSLLIRIIQAGNASSEMYEKAYENAKAIEDKSEQLNALMALLDEVDFDAQGSEADLVDEQQPAASSSEQMVADESAVPRQPADDQY